MDTASALNNGVEASARWSLRLFGGFELCALPGGEKAASLGKRERVLLAYLALSPKGSQPRRKLAALLWGDATDETLLDNLRASIWKLRKALGDTEHRLIASEGEDIGLDAAAFDVDALTFRRLASQAGRSELEAAANLYSGEFLDGLDIDSEEFESWRRAEATRYRDQAVDVLSRLMTQLVECGESERAIETGLRILRLEPLHEAAIRRLMRLYGESGRRGAAIQLYRTLADALKTELDAQPEAETRLVFAEITRGGEELTSAASAADARLPAHSTSTARPSDAPGEPPPPAEDLAPVTSASRQAKRGVLGWILAGGLAAAVIAMFLFQQFAPPAGRATAPASAITIAVLPFTNLSSDTEQEFFSDGITEEITSTLANVPGLIVIGRTSAFQFKGQNQDLRAIGQALGTTHVIEGSVRKAGDRVRITVQLIEANTGVHVWTENYDRQLTDIFAIQEDIAKAIAGSLRVPLGLPRGDTLVRNRTNNPESYDQYLRARALYRARSPGAIEGATKLLEQAVARDPGYVPAWALLARVYRDGSKKEKAAREAIRLDSRNAMGYLMLAGIQSQLGNYAAAEDLEKQALALDPDDTDVLDAFSNGLAIHGRVKEAASLREKLRTLEPFVPVYNYITASILLNNGQSQAAIAILKELPAGPAGGGEGARGVTLARAYAAEGRYGEAADTLLAIPPQQSRQNRGSIEEAARLLRAAPAKVSMPDALPAWDGELSFVYLYVGAPDRALDQLEHGRVLLDPPAARYLWSSELAPVRKTERFKAFVRAAGYVDYWRARGWPDRCRPLGADDFVCE